MALCRKVILLVSDPSRFELLEEKMTSIVAVVQVTAVLTIAVLIAICLVATYENSGQ